MFYRMPLNTGLGLRPVSYTHLDVYKRQLLITGESGVGKSETAIELVKRGHRLIADDAVELRRISNRSILGTAPANIRHFIEPVSYTHLDVYKRHVPHRCRSGSGRCAGPRRSLF